MSSYSLLPFLSFCFSCPPLLCVTGEVGDDRDVSRHKDIPAPNISWLMPSRDQSRGNLKYSLKNAEFTCLLLTFFFFFPAVLLLIERHLRFTSPTKGHVSVQVEVSDQSNSVSKWSFFNQTALLGILQKYCNPMIPLIKEKVAAQVLKGFTLS